MSRRLARATLPAALPLASLLLVACLDDGGIVGPIDAEEVTIRLTVSGGLAGVRYTVVLDGREGRVIGESCIARCNFESGDLLLPVSARQVESLARRFEDAGVLEMDGRDFRSECCDGFGYVLTYTRGGRSARLTGGGPRLPEDLGRAVGLLHGTVGRRLPALVSPDTRDGDWPRDPYTLGEVRVEGLGLTAGMTFGGGCGEHRIDLVAWGGWMESEPLRINALLTHDDGDDPCDALLTEERTFELLPLREAYEAAYGRIGEERPTILLLLWDPLGAGPVGRVIEVVL